jgi:hypothetical protein
MTDSNTPGYQTDSPEGRVFRPQTQEELKEAIEQAFDYRGDVTLELASGTSVEGYLYNRDLAGPRPTVQLFPRQGSGLREIPYDDIVAIHFTGEDTAFGKSWDAWVAKKESQRRAEAERATEAARVRGHL